MNTIDVQNLHMNRPSNIYLGSRFLTTIASTLRPATMTSLEKTSPSRAKPNYSPRHSMISLPSKRIRNLRLKAPE